MVQEGTNNPNVTLKGYPKKFWGLFGQKADKTQQITLSQPQKGGLSLSLMSHGQTYNPKCKPKRLPNKTLGFSWDGCVYSTHNTAKFPDWFNSQNQFFHWLRQCHQYLGPYKICPNQIFTMRAPHTYLYVMHLTFCGRIFKHTILKVQYN